MLTQLSTKDQIVALKLENLGFFHHPDLHRNKPPKPEACLFTINGWQFADGILGIWAFKDGHVFLSNKVILTEKLKVEIFKAFKSEKEARQKQRAA